ncbi:RNA polymerase ECF sigma factor [Amycolatopsis vancoresmycina DSM 44592]|uniref:RNA polymerase ECF sigma factor n=1 Tax=Amycolatopsis vancoresmycina DSM 44592 TaxID=1292037 RepID=R1I6N7_9PSEU|nr:RNA polymerase ECF sigma factor [Amycolatopsis vancoresmycina DSM 44592]
MQATLPGLLRYGHALTGNPHDAADLVQTVLEKIGSRWTYVHDKTGDPLAYVRRSMANAHVSRWRRTRRENLVADLPDTCRPPCLGCCGTATRSPATRTMRRTWCRPCWKRSVPAGRTSTTRPVPRWPTSAGRWRTRT